MPKYREAAKSELDAQRELLDSLMGINRNNDRKSDQVVDFRDDRVCKYFIAAMCPHDLFVNTKMDEGPCPKIHSEALKIAFEKHNDPHMYDSVIEKEFLARISDAEKIIKRARARVEDDNLDESTDPDVNPDIIRIHGEMSKIINEAENAAEMNDIDRAQELILTRYEDLVKEKAAIMNRINELKKQKSEGNCDDETGPDKKLRVCDVCGSFLSIFDSDKRLTDHFLGKQHIGFQYMRDTVEAMRKYREERRAKEREKARERDNDRRDKDRDRERDRNRDRDRDRERERERNTNSDSRRRDSSRERKDNDHHRRSDRDSRDRRDRDDSHRRRDNSRRRSRSR